jgi:hypothetical protein
MEYGAHLPLIDFGAEPSLHGLKEHARTAAGLGYRYLCGNDHLLFSRPWLDGPTGLAAGSRTRSSARSTATSARRCTRRCSA